MPALTLAVIMSEATTNVGGYTDLSASVVSLQANLAQLEIASMLPHGTLESVATLAIPANSASTALPADFGEMICLSRVSSYDSFAHRALTEIPIRIIANASNGTATGVPTGYAFYGATIVLYPTPSSADSLLLRYIKVPGDMTALTDYPSIHTRYHPAVLFKTCEYLADRKLDAERAAYWRNRFISYMGSMPTTADVRAE